VSKFLTVSEWSMNRYATFTMPYDLISDSWPIVIALVLAYLTLVFTVKPRSKHHHRYNSSKSRILNVVFATEYYYLTTIRQAWNTGLALYCEDPVGVTKGL